VSIGRTEMKSEGSFRLKKNANEDYTKIKSIIEWKK